MIRFGVARITYEVTALVRPTPRATSITNGIAELLMRLEVVQVDILALVGLVGISLDSLNAAVLALNLVLLGALAGEA